VAFYLCLAPEGRPVTLRTLVRIAGRRWPIEEDFQTGKDAFGLDHSQVRTYPALLRHLVLAMAALAICAITAAHARTTAGRPPTPADPRETPPADPGLLLLTVPEVKRLVNPPAPASCRTPAPEAACARSLPSVHPGWRAVLPTDPPSRRSILINVDQDTVLR
jgi:hypothetical protein